MTTQINKDSSDVLDFFVTFSISKIVKERKVNINLAESTVSTISSDSGKYQTDVAKSSGIKAGK